MDLAVGKRNCPVCCCGARPRTIALRPYVRSPGVSRGQSLHSGGGLHDE